jgi:succinate dehydrogenase/fumarate reductase flavoprotein subunit
MSSVLPGHHVADEVGGRIQGANRLMGNSLLDIIVFGRIAGTTASEFIANCVKDGKLTLEHLVKYDAEVASSDVVSS